MIICLLGKSSSGKSTFLKRVLEDKTLNLKTLPSYTTRPRRNKNENEYVYLKDEEFLNMKDSFIDVTEFEVASCEIWRYSTINKDDIKPNQNYIVIVNPASFKQIKKNLKEDIVSIYLNISDKERFIRSLKREDNPNIHEIYRRMLSDEKDFKEIEVAADHIITNPKNHFNETLYKIKKVIRTELIQHDKKQFKKIKK